MFKDYRQELINKIFIGNVEDIDDPKMKGRVKVRIERIHGRKTDKNNVPTSDLPWSSPDLENRGLAFSIPAVGKVVYVEFLEGDWYKPVYTCSEHFNYNLQSKLQSLTKTQYEGFYAIKFDDKHQYYHDVDNGIIFDYVKSNFNIDTSGNMYLNLRDNNSKLYLGTNDAPQSAVLGDHFMEWFDTFIQNLMGAEGGPYLGNLGAPVIPNPGLLECLNQYLAIRQTFLSIHVKLTDNMQVNPQNRAFDKVQDGDNYNTETQQDVNAPNIVGYSPVDRAPSAIKSVNPEVPTDNFSNTLSSTQLPPNPTADELKKTEQPFTGYSNGNLPLTQLTQSKYAVESFPDTTTEESYFIDSVAKNLDSWLDSYFSQRDPSWSDVIVTKGYQNYERQQNIRTQYGPSAPLAGQDPFGFANQVELYFGVASSDLTDRDALTNYLEDGTNDGTNTSVQILDWLVKNGAKYNFQLTGRDVNGNQQWWHWIYIGT